MNLTGLSRVFVEKRWEERLEVPQEWVKVPGKEVTNEHLRNVEMSSDFAYEVSNFGLVSIVLTNVLWSSLF